MKTFVMFLWRPYSVSDQTVSRLILSDCSWLFIMQLQEQNTLDKEDSLEVIKRLKPWIYF